MGHLYLAIDSDGEAKLAALQNSNRVPKPTAIISTSPNKYQVLWRVEGVDFENQERTLKLLGLFALMPANPLSGGSLAEWTRRSAREKP